MGPRGLTSRPAHVLAMCPLQPNWFPFYIFLRDAMNNVRNQENNPALDLGPNLGVGPPTVKSLCV